MMDGEFIRAFNRSELRKKVYIALYNMHPDKFYLSEIARMVYSDPGNIRGVLTGLEPGYSTELSLVGLGLVEILRVKNSVYYRIHTQHKPFCDEVYHVLTSKRIVEIA
ncbi:MAG: transcriptional regulator [Thermoplasmata archaeon]|nr:transcriptional regulator [Candidatus Sysuiplasma jiujiangense]